MRRIQIPTRYRKLAALSILLVTFLLIYFITGSSFEGIAELVIQGEKFSARHYFAAFIWLLAAVLANMALSAFIWEGIIQRRTGSPVPQLLKTVSGAIIIIITLIFIVAFVFHKSITGLLATTGAVGIIVGLSARGILEDAAQGISLNIAKVFKPGDVISIPGKFDELAMVKDITMRNTYLEDFVGHVVAIPNSVICANVVRNYSRAQIFSVCFSIVLGVRGLSILDAQRILKAVIASTDFVVLDPAPLVLIADIQNHEVKYDISCWMEQYKTTPIQAKHTIYTNIIEQLAAAGFIVGEPYIDYDEIEKRLAVIFNKFDRFSHLSPEEKESFVQHELGDRRIAFVLKQVALFSSLNTEEIEAISAHIKTLYYKAGETIIRQGEKGDLMYILVEGALQVYIQSLEQADLIPVAHLTPGKYFGEMSLLVGEPRSATIVSLTDTMVYEINKKTMSELFQLHPEMIQKLSDRIAEQQMINLGKQREYTVPEALDQKRSFASSFMKRITKFFSEK